MKPNKQDIMFRYLIDKMLKPHGITAQDILNSNDREWRTRYQWTTGEHDRFVREAGLYIKGVLPLSRKQALKTAKAFADNFGLKIKTI